MKEHLRESARKNTSPLLNPIELTDSIEHVAAELERDLAASDINFDCSRYLTSIKKKLGFSSRWMVEKAGDLDELRKEAKITPSWVETLDSGVSVEFTKIGFIDAVYSLFLNPITASDELKIDDLGNEYQIHGDGFPFEIWLRGVNYVLDDDGTIFVSTERLPQQAVEGVLDDLRVLANQLYTM